MKLTLMSKKTGQISYNIPNEVKKLIVNLDDVSVLDLDGSFIEPLKSVLVQDDEIISLDPLKEING